ncbi:hypothetical protein GWI33_022412 [Rhynchophorus ferrugineus]|uniref:Uncharacterized protein n=1 Tax=Rhynchophorus ferrugineus TaxID=354439 RepID=A0A834MJ12_RHYFE|nr:hypothetical protein GWI33_022412 [Rhynchophorus ferrugineus]
MDAGREGARRLRMGDAEGRGRRVRHEILNSILRGNTVSESNITVAEAELLFDLLRSEYGIRRKPRKETSSETVGSSGNLI